jgi:hypothetical protein
MMLIVYVIMEDLPLTIELSNSEAIKLFNDLDNTDLNIDDKKLIRGAFNFHLYLAKRLQEPGLKLKEIREMYGIRLKDVSSTSKNDNSQTSNGATSKENNTNEAPSEPPEEPEPDKQESSKISKNGDMADGKGRKTGVASRIMPTLG